MNKVNKAIQYQWFWSTMVIGFALTLSIIVTHSNRSIFLYLNNWAVRSSPVLWSNLSILGDTLVALVLFLPWIRKRNDLIWALFFAAIVSIAISQGLKHLLAIPRPPAVFSNNTINIIGPIYKNNSFPSGHATTIFTIISLLIFTIKNTKLKLFFFLSATLIAVSRVVIGVHWPTDIIGGMLTGFLSSYIGLRIYSRLNKKLADISFSVISGIILILSVFLMSFYKIQYPSTLLLKNTLGVVAILNHIIGVYLNDKKRILLTLSEVKGNS